MLMANVLAEIYGRRSELESLEKDLIRINRLIITLQDQRQHIADKITAIEIKIEELEDELDA